jgi:hypothetical protein
MQKEGIKGHAVKRYEGLEVKLHILHLSTTCTTGEQLHTLAIQRHVSQDSVRSSIKKIFPKVKVPGTTNIQKYAYKSSHWSLLFNKKM